MKKILSLLLVLAMLLGFAGCMPSATPQATDTPTQTTLQTETTAPEETEAPTEVSTEATEPEETQAPTEAPEPEPTQPKPTQPTEQEDPRPRPTQDPHETEPEVTEPEETEPEETEPEETPPAPQKSYTGKEEVAAYIAQHGRLPDNFITKSEAKKLGWKSGSLERYAPGKCIGGDRFYNNERLLPTGKTYYECDIDTLGKSSRGAKRIVFSSDGDIYHTSDHYASFYRYLGPNQWEKV